MAILKNITETGTDFDLLFERDEYITDLSKTNPNLIGSLGCSHRNFPKICRALKRYSGQKDRKMLRHFVVSISPCDEKKLPNTELLKAARKISAFFKDCYVKYAIHTNTAHTHFHILVCNTRISDGKQISMSDSDLNNFKAHCSRILCEVELEPVTTVDKNTSSDSLEISEDLFPKALTQEERVKILYGDEPIRNTRKPYYENSHYSPGYVNTTINVIIPPGTQGTLFQGRNGTPCISFKPSISHGQTSITSQCGLSNIVNTEGTFGNSPLFLDSSDNFDDFNDEEPEWISSDNTDFSDEVGDDLELIDESNPEPVLVDPFVIEPLPIDPFIIIKK